MTNAAALFLSIGGWFLWNIILAATYAPDKKIYYVADALFERWGRSLAWWLCLLLILSSVLVFEFGVASLRAAFFPTPEDVFQALEKDPAVKRRFEEAASEELQMGWDWKQRGREEKIRAVVRKAEAKAEEAREEAVREMLRGRLGSEGVSGERPGAERRDERPTIGEEMGSGEVDRILSRGYGKVRED